MADYEAIMRVGHHHLYTLVHRRHGVWVFEARHLVLGIVKYGRVLGSRGPDVVHPKAGFRVYTIRKIRRGKGRFSYTCTCDDHLLRGNQSCRHIARFVLAERGEPGQGGEADEGQAVLPGRMP